MQPDTFFSTADRERIADAIRQAEARTSGEIVPYVVSQSANYPDVPWRAGSTVAIAALFVFAVLQLTADLPLLADLTVIVLITLGAYVVGAGISIFIPAIRRFFIPSATIDEEVERRARLAFLSEEVFSTRDRTGILIFLSLFERRVTVLGDSGINALVTHTDWQDVVNTITASISTGKPADGLVQAIEKCGALLERKGVEIRHDDTNELEDSLRMGE